MRRGLFWAAILAVALGGVSAAARADWRDDVKVLRVAFLAGDNATYRTAQLEPFRAYMQDRIGIPVELVPARTLPVLIDAQVSGRVQYAIDTAASFAAASVGCSCIEPLAVPAAADGGVGFHAILLARSGSPIRSLADAKGARLALTGEDSVAGSLVPTKAFEREGIVPKEFFSSVVRAADPKSAIGMLLSGEVDLAVGWSSLSGEFAGGYDRGVLTEMVAAADLSMDEVRIVWQSDLIPFGPHAVRTSLPEELKGLLRDALLAMAGEDPAAFDAVDRTGGGGFAAIDAGAYSGMVALVSAPPTAPDR